MTTNDQTADLLIPDAVAFDASLSPNARLLWGVIRQSEFARQASRLYRTPRTGIEYPAAAKTTRYCRGLVQAGYLRETRVAGQPTIRELLLNDELLNQYKQEQVGGTH